MGLEWLWANHGSGGFKKRGGDRSGHYHSIALTAEGKVVVWGYALEVITQVPGDLGPVRAIGRGNMNVLALQKDGVVRAWGFGRTNATGAYYDYVQSMVPLGLTNIIKVTGG